MSDPQRSPTPQSSTEHADPKVARQQLEDAEFELGRLQSLKPRLEYRQKVGAAKRALIKISWSN
jgi:hypothetical protein